MACATPCWTLAPPWVPSEPLLLSLLHAPVTAASLIRAGRYLEKYGLKPFDAILAEEKHLPIFPDLIDNHKPDYCAGGSAQNSIRVAQW